MIMNILLIWKENANYLETQVLELVHMTVCCRIN